MGLRPRDGGVADDEMLMALLPCYLPQVVPGLAELDKHGLRYPIPPWGIQADPSPSPAGRYAGD